MVITSKSNYELDDALRGICHTIQSTAMCFGHNIAFEELEKLTRKKSRPNRNFIKLNRLSTSLSMDELEGKNLGDWPSSQHLNQKINQFGKMLGSKFFGIVKQSSSIPLQFSALIYTDTSLENEAGKFVVDGGVMTTTESKSEPEVAGNEKTVDLGEIVEEYVNNRAALKNNSSGLSLTAKMSNNNNNNNEYSLLADGDYIPRLNQKHYANRLDKINEAKNFIVKESQTSFIFI